MSKMSDYALALEAERVRVWRLDEQAEREFLLKYTKDKVTTATGHKPKTDEDDSSISTAHH